MLGWLVDRDIDPHIPVWDQSEVAADGRFVRDDFTYDKDRDLYICPGGKVLKTSGTVHEGTTIKYIAKRSDCSICPLKPNWTDGRERRISRDVNEEARDYTRAVMETEAYGVSCGDARRSKGSLARPSTSSRWFASDCEASPALETSSC